MSDDRLCGFMMHRCRLFSSLSLFFVLSSAAAAPSSEPVDFFRDVEPILRENCYACHGPRIQSGGLRLDSRESAGQGGASGRPPIVPGRSRDSILFQALTANDSSDIRRMPAFADPLPGTEIELIRRWIDQGADWPGQKGSRDQSHWAFVRPQRPALPSPESRERARNPIDSFILERLEAEHLNPSPEAARATLARRVHLDLVGLPPSVSELDRFLQDGEPGAFERMVDRLLASPHFGERWARDWLDVARYADTNGYEKDRVRSIWPYRDWVIRALNEDLPFDRFVVDQLAGDMVPGAGPEERIATGFHRNTMLNEEGGIDVEEFRFASVVDRVNTTAGAFLGLTLACAQCHDHKYDPISQAEYFRFFSFLNNADEPEMRVPDRRVAEKRKQIQEQIRSLESRLSANFPSYGHRSVWDTTPPLAVTSSGGARLTRRPDGSIEVSGPNPEQEAYRWVARPETRVDQIRLEVFHDPAGSPQGPGRGEKGEAVLSEIELYLKNGTGGSLRRLSLVKPAATLSREDVEVFKAFDGDPETGWELARTYGHHQAVFRVEKPVRLAPGEEMVVVLQQLAGDGKNLSRFRISPGEEHRTSYHPDLSEPEQRGRHLAAKYEAWKKKTRRLVRSWSVRRPLNLVSGKSSTLTVLGDESVLASGDRPNSDIYSFEIEPGLPAVTGLRIEFLSHESLPGGGPGRGTASEEGNFMLSEITVQGVSPSAPAGSSPYALRRATADSFRRHLHPGMTLDGDRQTGWSPDRERGTPQSIVYEFQEPIVVADGERFRVTLVQNHIHTHTIGRFRVFVSDGETPLSSSGLPLRIESILSASPDAVTPDDRQALLRHYLSVAPELREEQEQIQALRKTMPGHPTTLVMAERTSPRTTRIRHRGEFLEPRDHVSPGVPAVLHPWPADQKRDRLTFARWLVSRENPLLARVVMNRLWSSYFGRGLVATVNDFGLRGSSPSHPGLLDWLAVEFMAQDWSMKAMHRRIVLSSTYRQSSRLTPELLEKDPENALYARGSRFRVNAETIRDISLAVGGLLSPKLGGQSVFPPQPASVADLIFGEKEWNVSEGEDRYRRGLYTFWKRTVPYPAFTTFDAPQGETTCLRRGRSNTPLQALTLLNDPVFVEAARGFALRILEDAPASARIDYAFRRCLSRAPDRFESAAVQSYLEAQLNRIRTGGMGGNQESEPELVSEGVNREELMAWTAVARVLLNLDRTISKE